VVQVHARQGDGVDRAEELGAAEPVDAEPCDGDGDVGVRLSAKPVDAADR
jgi:hypothetical protein